MTSCGVFPSGIFPIKLLSIWFRHKGYYLRSCPGQLLCKTLFLASVTYSKRSAIDSAFPIVCHCVCLSVCNVRKILQDLFKTPDRPGMGFGSVAKTA